jgi:hypothetical protein
MNIHRPTLTLLAALLCSLAAPAQAGRPLQTDDAGVLDRGACEVEGATGGLKVSGVSGHDSSLQLSCGIGLSTQLALAANRATADGGSARGIQFNGKTGLWKGKPVKDDQAAALTLGYAVASVQSAGDNSWQHAVSEVNLIYSRPLAGELTLHANLGHRRDEIEATGSTTWGLALEHAGFGAWAPMAELFGDDRDAAWWNLGLRFTAVPDKVFIDASYGRMMTGGTPSLWTVGFKVAF